MKRVLNKVFCLPPVATIIVATAGFTFVFFELANGKHGIFTYVSYLLSAYALIITITGVVRFSKWIGKNFNDFKIVRKIKSTRLDNLILSDDVFRSSIGLYTVLVFNVLYIVLNFFYGIKYHSFWFVSLGFYYIALSAMRSVLVQFIRTNKVRENIKLEYKYYRICGIIFLFLNIALSFIVFYRVKEGKATAYGGTLIYAVALYTFYCTINAVVSVIKYRKNGSPVLSAIKAISFTASLVSMLSLESAMIAQFSNEGEQFRKNMTASLGAAICTMVLCMSIYMISKSTKIITKGNGGNEK